jgi:hypothetical protein
MNASITEETKIDLSARKITPFDGRREREKCIISKESILGPNMYAG